MYNYENSPYTMGANVNNAPYQTAPAYSHGYCAPVQQGNGFAIIVVLFILLIIVGAAIVPQEKC
ncbi:YjcZ family sporulation protein [Radiobacillus sp. PE A8.2]|uniref:YjcZ family sporulation protein n=1 Tax=Radiobacillus sp. PE A8.2 TaxID=3380349 RepID=UPI003890F465